MRDVYARHNQAPVLEATSAYAAVIARLGRNDPPLPLPDASEQVREPRLPAFLLDDDMEAANGEPVVSRLAAALAAGPAARLAAEELAARRARRS